MSLEYKYGVGLCPKHIVDSKKSTAIEMTAVKFSTFPIHWGA
jgi:hypothetical protein